LFILLASLCMDNIQAFSRWASYSICLLVPWPPKDPNLLLFAFLRPFACITLYEDRLLATDLLIFCYLVVDGYKTKVQDQVMEPRCAWQGSGLSDPCQAS
jgi:hypothetical protein